MYPYHSWIVFYSLWWYVAFCPPANINLHLVFGITKLFNVVVSSIRKLFLWISIKLNITHNLAEYRHTECFGRCTYFMCILVGVKMVATDYTYEMPVLYIVGSEYKEIQFLKLLEKIVKLWKSTHPNPRCPTWSHNWKEKNLWPPKYRIFCLMKNDCPVQNKCFTPTANGFVASISTFGSFHANVLYKYLLIITFTQAIHRSLASSLRVGLEFGYYRTMLTANSS